jgi:hypothetical protein
VDLLLTLFVLLVVVGLAFWVLSTLGPAYHIPVPILVTIRVFLVIVVIIVLLNLFVPGWQSRMSLTAH